MPVAATDRTTVLRAVAEPVRWRILERLATEDLCVCHLVEDLALPQPLVSHHLAALRRAGLVEPERHRQWTYYRLRPAALDQLAGELTALATGPAPTGGDRRRPCC